MVLTVFVYSFVADSSLLDCCDLVVGFLFVCFFSTLCLQVGHRLGFWGGFSCFVPFIWCQLFVCLVRTAIFRLPPAFVVWSFFPCHRHLWSVLSFYTTGICGLFFLSIPQAFVYSLFYGLFCRRHSCLCLVSACFRVSVYLSTFGIMLCACCSSAEWGAARSAGQYTV